METLSSEQKVMEARYILPYNWMRLPSSRHWRQKNGIWEIASKLCSDIAGKTVLDAGCGDGWYSARMHEKGAVVHGCDFSGKAISFANIIVPKVTFKAGSLLNLPYEDNFFDVVFSFQVLEHIPPSDLPKAISEVHRVLKTGGIFIPSVPTAIRPMSTAHYQHFTQKSIATVLEKEFSIEKNIGQECYTPILKMIERVLDNRVWLLHRFATAFHKGFYLKFWNEGLAHKGHNFVIRAVKK
jgi:ubiquinone/menaquinone biosynthesis C-methylase UbiE